VPIPFNFDQLRENVTDYETVFLMQFWNIRSKGDLHRSYVCYGWVCKRSETNIAKIVVLCLAAADMPIADLVKIDTEGSQVENLRGLNLVRLRPFC